MRLVNHSIPALAGSASRGPMTSQPTDGPVAAAERSTNRTQDGGRECVSVSVMDWNGRAKNTQSRAERGERKRDGGGERAVDAGDAVTGHHSD